MVGSIFTECPTTVVPCQRKMGLIIICFWQLHFWKWNCFFIYSLFQICRPRKIHVYVFKNRSNSLRRFLFQESVELVLGAKLLYIVFVALNECLNEIDFLRRGVMNALCLFLVAVGTLVCASVYCCCEYFCVRLH